MVALEVRRAAPTAPQHVLPTRFTFHHNVCPPYEVPVRSAVVISLHFDFPRRAIKSSTCVENWPQVVFSPGWTGLDALRWLLTLHMFEESVNRAVPAPPQHAAPQWWRFVATVIVPLDVSHVVFMASAAVTSAQRCLPGRLDKSHCDSTPQLATGSPGTGDVRKALVTLHKFDELSVKRALPAPPQHAGPTTANCSCSWLFVNQLFVELSTHETFATSAAVTSLHLLRCTILFRYQADTVPQVVVELGWTGLDSRKSSLALHMFEESVKRALPAPPQHDEL